MSYKFLKSLFFGAFLLGSSVTFNTAVLADQQISGNINLSSDYRFRGISQSDRSLAISGGLEYQNNGYYAGVWGSSVAQADATLELDLYLGRSIEKNGTLYTVGLAHYVYPRDGYTFLGEAQSLDYTELQVSASYLGGSVGLNYTDQYYAETGKYFYVYADYGIDFQQSSLLFHLGVNKFDNIMMAQKFIESPNLNDDQYIDWSVMLTIPSNSIDFHVGIVGTDLNETECAMSKNCKNEFVFQVSKAL